MIRHVWTVYCRQVITDKDTGAVSALQLLDGVTVSVNDDSSSSDKVPVQMDSVLMTVWARRVWDTPVMSRMRIRMVAPDGDVLMSNIAEVDLRDSIMHRLMGRSNVFVVKGNGMYEWVIEREADDGEKGPWIEQARIPVRVEVNNDSLSSTQAE